MDTTRILRGKQNRNTSSTRKVGSLIILLLIGVCNFTLSQDVGPTKPKIPYEWGSMKQYHQILKNEVREGRFNESKSYEFAFQGHRTTYNLKIEDYQGEGRNPCYVEPRDVEIEFDRLDDQLNLPIHRYVAMHSFSDIVLALTHEYKIFIFTIKKLPFARIDLKVANKIQIPHDYLTEFDLQTQNTTIISSYDGKYVHMLFPHIMFTIYMPVELHNIVSIGQEHLTVNQKYKARKNIVASRFVKGYLFVSHSEDGIDVYKIDDNSSHKQYDHVSTLNQEALKLSYPLNAQDLALDYSNRLYIVCRNNGVIIYEVDQNSFAQSSVVHIISMLKNANQIAVRGDHTLVVTGNEDGYQYIKEVFFNIETNNYFINRQFIDDQFKWQDVQMGDLFTFIQGKGVHRILYQGINNQLIPQEDKHSDFRQGIALQELDLYEVKQIQSVSQGKTSFIAISDNAIFGIELREIPPQVKCAAYKRDNIGENKMKLVYNSTDCALANYHSPILYNVWQMCQTDIQFTYIVHDIWIDGQNVHVAGFIAAIIVLSLTVLFLLSLFLYRSYKNKYIQTDHELTDMKQKYQVLESATATQQRDATMIQDKSSLHFNRNNDADSNSLK